MDFEEKQKRMFRKHVNPKKQHEISVLSKVCYANCFDLDYSMQSDLFKIVKLHTRKNRSY